jgi:hypothetical protein
MADVTVETALINTTNQSIAGAVVLQECVVKNCTFHKISFIGQSDQMARLRKFFPPATTK